MKELDKSKVYDLSELTNDELKETAKYMQDNHGWKGQVPHTDLFWHEVSGTWLYNKHDKVNNMVNAKELFYTLENVQVDCRELTEEQIDNLVNVYESNNIPKYKGSYDREYVKGRCNFIMKNYSGCHWFSDKEIKFTTITYDKFMELFAPQYEVKMIVEAPKEDKPIQYQIGIDAIGIAEKNMTIDECLAIARFNITKYSYRKKNQDLEDFKKVIAYANWAIKLLNKK